LSETAEGLKQLIESFLDHLRFEKNSSPNTINSYARDLTEFHVYLTGGDPESEVDLADIDHITIRDFLGELYRKGNRKSSVARKLAAIRSFFRHLHREGKVRQNPARLVQTPKQPRKNPDCLSEAEVEAFLSLPDDTTPKGARDLAILELLYGSGLRVSELVALNVEDCSLVQRLLKVRGKGRKERLAPFGEKARGALQRYLAIRLVLLARARLAREPNALFLNLRGARITARSIQRMIENYVREGALALDVHPHLFRHSFATHLLNRGADLRTIQELLGHKELSTTQKYTSLAVDQLLKAYRDSHPRAIRVTGLRRDQGKRESR
jgi:integrase/recombinase XerC